RRLVSDVPLGALLSGGIDSAVVVAQMAQASSEPVRTFTVGFADERYDERRFARAAADRWSTHHEEIVLEPDVASPLPQLAAALWTDDAKAEIGALTSSGFLLGVPPRGGVTGLQLLDVATYLPGDLLPKSDIASMAHSLELRSPLLDHRVLELGLSLPARLKQRGLEGKLALRRAFADDLPPLVVGRGKSGFGVPLAAWFRGELQPLAREVLLDERARARGLFHHEAVARLLDEHAAERADHGHRLWTLVMLELWQR